MGRNMGFRLNITRKVNLKSAEYLRHCYFVIYDFLDDDKFVAFCNDFNELKRYTFLSIYDISKKYNRSSNDFIVINHNNKLYNVYAYYEI